MWKPTTTPAFSSAAALENVVSLASSFPPGLSITIGDTGTVPFAIFIPPAMRPSGSRIDRSSTTRPCRNLIYSVWPLIACPEPGIAFARRDPARASLSMRASRTFNASSTRTSG